jgi:hypothetical protein
MTPSRDREPRHTASNDGTGELKKLTTIPVDALERARQHDLDLANPLFLSEEDSKIAIGQAMREAMSAQEITVYILQEKTGLSCDVIEALMSGTGDISDSDPIQRLEFALRTPLTHL